MLRGVLEASFGNFLCLRGFAKLGELADISTADESYQREVDTNHRDDITAFYESGQYLFFPELILGVSFSSLGLDEAKFMELYDAVRVGHLDAQAPADARRDGHTVQHEVWPSVA